MNGWKIAVIAWFFALAIFDIATIGIDKPPTTVRETIWGLCILSVLVFCVMQA